MWLQYSCELFSLSRDHCEVDYCWKWVSLCCQFVINFISASSCGKRIEWNKEWPFEGNIHVCNQIEISSINFSESSISKRSRYAYFMHLVIELLPSLWFIFNVWVHGIFISHKIQLWYNFRFHSTTSIFHLRLKIVMMILLSSHH